VALSLAPETVIVAGPLWTVAVNRNQNLIGKTMLVANRRVESVTALYQDEWLDLHRQISRVTIALDQLFRPDQYNHAFLMNVDAQVHLHVVPRYPRGAHLELAHIHRSALRPAVRHGATPAPSRRPGRAGHHHPRPPSRLTNIAMPSPAIRLDTLNWVIGMRQPPVPVPPG
jgi:diadenosine tetraphosphate (Ap4A) HIT family hydrolase